MTEIKQAIATHLVAVMVFVGVVLAMMLAVAVLLYRELVSDHYDRTRRALLRIVQTVLGLRKAVKGDATADDELSKTITPGEVKAKDVQP